VVGIIAVAAAVGCSQQRSSSTIGTFDLASPTSPSLASSTGGTVKETLTSAALNSVGPEGEALADQSNYLTGGSTILTVQIKKVNVPDGTALGVTLDFTQLGSISVSRGEGTARFDLGHFAVSNDQVRVNRGSTTILIGSFFR
jgi:hypothetical protein